MISIERLNFSPQPYFGHGNIDWSGYDATEKDDISKSLLPSLKHDLIITFSFSLDLYCPSARGSTVLCFILFEYEFLITQSSH